MKDKILKYIVPCAFMLLFAVAAWAFWAFVYPAHMHLAEQLQMFEYTTQYFLDTAVKPAGVAEYISRYLIQFFYSEPLGPVVMALLLMVVYHSAMLLGMRMPHKDTKPLYVSFLAATIALVPAILVWAFLVSMDAKLTMPVALALSLYAVLLTDLVTRKVGNLVINYAVIAVMAVILAFAVGSIFVVYVMLAVVALCCKLKASGTIHFNKLLYSILFALILWFAVDNIVAYVYPYPHDALTWGGYYNRFIFITAENNVSTWWFTTGSLSFLLLVTRMKQPKAMTYVAAVAGIVAASACAVVVSKKVNKDEEGMLQNMYLMHMERWDDIIERSHQSAPATSYEQAPLNLAYAIKGQLADRYFATKQYGISGLLPRYQMDYMTPLLSADAYYHMGMVNTAQRFYYESMESIADHQKSAFLLQRLTMTALANGRYALAKRYIHRLKNTRYYSQWAAAMEKYADNPSTIDQHTVLHRLRAMRTKQESLFSDDNPPAYIAEMLNGNPDNLVAWQYLFMSLMVEGRLDELMQTAQFYTTHFPQKMLPVHVQEALLYTWVTKTGGVNGFPWRVHNEVGQRFMQFAQQANQPREIAEPIVRRDYADTFWCYAVFKAQEQQTASQSAVPDARTGASQQAPSRE